MLGITEMLLLSWLFEAKLYELKEGSAMLLAKVTD